MEPVPSSPLSSVGLWKKQQQKNNTSLITDNIINYLIRLQIQTKLLIDLNIQC